MPQLAKYLFKRIFCLYSTGCYLVSKGRWVFSTSYYWYAKDVKTRILLLLAAAGVVVSGYLVLKSSDPSGVICSIGGGCETVLSSKYAKFLGQPVAGYGLLWYIGTLALIWVTATKRIIPWLWFQLWATIGLVCSLYLLYLEAFVIHAYCTWCLVSLALVSLIFIMSFVRTKESFHVVGR